MSLRRRLDTLRRESGAVGPLNGDAPAADASPGHDARITDARAAATGEAPKPPSEQPRPSPNPETRAKIERLRRQIEAVRTAGEPSPPGVAPARPWNAASPYAAPFAGSTAAPGFTPLQVGTMSAAKPRRGDDARLAELLRGEIVAPGVILTERSVPLSRRHGAVALHRTAGPVEGLPEGNVDPRGVVFLDTETSGLAGGTGTVIFLLGLARLAGDALVVRQYMLTAFSGEAAMLESAAEWVGGLEGMVTYNGRSFDLPLVAARCRLTGVTDRFSHLRHLDLLPPTRRAFARRWGDCRLTTAERRLLRFERENDLPGWAAPESWFAYVRHGDATRLPLVAEHNFHDVVTLAALVPALADAHAEPGAFEADILAVARAFERYGASGRAYRLLEEHEAMLDTDGLLELARYYRASNDWPRACEIWQRLAARGVAEAVERLAKYHEHVRRDYAAALALAERLPPVPDHDRRRHRLRRKLEQNGQEPR